jgi:DNA-binding NarL/FixJ family response regulator
MERRMSLRESVGGEHAITSIAVPNRLTGRSRSHSQQRWHPMSDDRSHSIVTPATRALRAGADDCVTKPIGGEELIARLEAVFRRVSAEPATSAITVDGLEVDLAAHVVRTFGGEIHLTRTEFDLLRVLVVNRGRLLTRRMLLSEV